ncbi:MAG: sigma-70 family RNA polymerase sigma factor [bacterium]
MNKSQINELIYLMRCGDALAEYTLYHYYLTTLPKAIKKQWNQNWIDYDPEDVVQILLMKFDLIVKSYRDDVGSFGSFVKMCVKRKMMTLIKNQNHLNRINTISLDAAIHEDDYFHSRGHTRQIHEIIADEGKRYAPDVQYDYQCFYRAIYSYMVHYLSARERQIFSMAQYGYRPAEIADEMHVSIKIVYNVIHRTTRKLKSIYS